MGLLSLAQQKEERKLFEKELLDKKFAVLEELERNTVGGNYRNPITAFRWGDWLARAELKLKAMRDIKDVEALMQYYMIETIPDLVAAQNSHIKDLQARIASSSTVPEPHWTDAHIKQVEGWFYGYDEAGMEHGKYATHALARDALVLYSVTQLRQQIG